MLGFALSTAAILAIPIVNLAFRPIVIIGAAHVLGQLEASLAGRALAEPRGDERLHLGRIGATAGGLHHRADEEAEEAGLAGAEGGDLVGVLGERGVDERLERAGVGLPVEAEASDDLGRLAALGDQRGEDLLGRGPGDGAVGHEADELAELGAADGERGDLTVAERAAGR